jgi:transcriptional regulator with XRE-family HTH domain
MSETFGGYLKDWRGRRRVSQLDLGLAANVSARHISFLETGRANPSKAMVIQLSDTLEVPRAERNALLNAAGFSPAYKARDLHTDEMAHIRAAVDWTLARHDPFPAIAIDRHWNLVKTNKCAELMLGALGMSTQGSFLDAFITPGPFRAALENWVDIARHMISRLQTESSHFGGDPILDAAIEKLKFSLSDAELNHAQPMPAVIPVKFNSQGNILSFFSTIAQFGSAEDIVLSDLRIELMFPADDATRQALSPS